MLEHKSKMLDSKKHYSWSSLTRTPNGQTKVSALWRCPYYRGRNCIHFGLFRPSELSIIERCLHYGGVSKERGNYTFLTSIFSTTYLQDTEHSLGFLHGGRQKHSIPSSSISGDSSPMWLTIKFLLRLISPTVMENRMFDMDKFPS